MFCRCHWRRRRSDVFDQKCSQFVSSLCQKSAVAMTQKKVYKKRLGACGWSRGPHWNHRRVTISNVKSCCKTTGGSLTWLALPETAGGLPETAGTVLEGDIRREVHSYRSALHLMVPSPPRARG
jgi:hypothetical protein